jgi:hypothetical protein
MGAKGRFDPCIIPGQNGTSTTHAGMSARCSCGGVPCWDELEMIAEMAGCADVMMCGYGSFDDNTYLGGSGLCTGGGD